MFKSLRDVPRGVWAVSISSMLIAISTGMTFSISPVFITSVLGLSMCSMGCLEGFSEALSQFSKLCSGISGDFSRKKKPTLMLGFFLAMISKPIFILAKGVELVAFSKIIERISNGIMATPRDAYVADHTPIAQRGIGFGLVMTAKTLGIALGSFLVGFLVLYTNNYRMILWLGFIPCLLAVFILWRYLDEKPTLSPEERQSILKSRENNKLILKDIIRLPAQYWSFLGVATVFMCARFSDSFLVLRLKELGAPDWLWASTIGLFNLTSALCCIPMGSLSDKYNRSNVLYLSFIALVIANICFLYAEGLVVALIGVVLWGAQRNTSQMIFSAIIADLAPRRSMGTALGVYYFFTGVIAYFANGMAGKFADQSSLAFTFEFGLICSSIALLFLFIHNMTIKPEAPVITVEQV